MTMVATGEASMRTRTATLIIAVTAVSTGALGALTGYAVGRGPTGTSPTDAGSACRAAVVTYARQRADDSVKSNPGSVATVSGVDLDTTTRQPDGTVKIGATIHYTITVPGVTMPEIVQATCTVTAAGKASVTQP